MAIFTVTSNAVENVDIFVDVDVDSDTDAFLEFLLDFDDILKLFIFI